MRYGNYVDDDEREELDVPAAIAAAGFPVRPCGLNADWSVSAWHFGAGDPNRDDGGIYLLDTEIGDDTFSVCRSYPSRREVADGGDDIEEIATDLSISDALAFIAEQLK